MKYELNYKMFLQCQTTYDCNMLTVMTAHYHVCVSGHCVPEDKRRKRDITAQLIPAEGDGEIVPLVCEGDHCVAKDMSPNFIPIPLVPSTDEPTYGDYILP